ncbi:hypothetical protein L210DRAFT_3394869 [Boletus edulis BED1]|uniref:G domain-containing protein n=1 Tax=Boletus edulis BED1 TaxID=1328754 RepID=A0AAD4GIV9_BOLED|nr:hypothetical protein L210DRAFT_3394869 [Boletus edulis BED1]
MRRELRRADNLPSYEAQRCFSPNVLVVGETGVGKSSVINLIAGEQVAPVHSGAGACTMEATSYDIVLPDDQGLSHHIRLFDTVGLNEPQFKKNDYLTAIEKANTLICQLQRTGGIRLLLFCIRGGRITSVMQNNYRLFCDILCQKQVPVAFVVTGLENEVSMEGWWERNVLSFEAYRLSCASHACVTGIRGLNDYYAEKYEQSQMAIRAMLLAHVTEGGTSWQPERTGWFIHLAGKLLKWLGQVKSRRRQAPTVGELARHLQDKCTIYNPPPAYDSQPCNVIIFGETGVGKSSVVNLIAGDKLAKTSPDAGACTFASNPYHIVLESNRPFCIWDTVGLNEPEISHDNYLRAVKQAYKLVKELERSGGVHLLLLCMRGRITKSVQQNYRLFANVLCERKVPLCVVVTNLENEPCMDDWWSANKEAFEQYGISADGHACITATPGVGDIFRDRYEESRERMRRLLLDSDSELKLSNEGWKKDMRTWLTDLLGKMTKMLPLRHRCAGHPTHQEIMEKLVNGCGFSKRDATAIAASIIGQIRDHTPGGDDGLA